MAMRYAHPSQENIYSKNGHDSEASAWVIKESNSLIASRILIGVVEGILSRT